MGPPVGTNGQRGRGGINRPPFRISLEGQIKLNGNVIPELTSMGPRREWCKLMVEITSMLFGARGVG